MNKDTLIKIDYKKGITTIRNDTCINPNPLINYIYKCHCEKCTNREQITIILTYIVPIVLFIIAILIDFIIKLYQNV